MVLWFKDSTGIPLYSLDARGGNLESANHSFISNDLGARTYFQTSGVYPARLQVNNVGVQDEGVFRCRVDFVDSPTRNFRVNLSIVVPPSRPVIYDDKGKEVAGLAGPFMEDYDLALSCHVMGGRPQPQVTWWHGGLLLDSDSETTSEIYTVNRLFIKDVSRSLLNENLQCRATSSDISPPVTRDVALEIYLKPRTVEITSPAAPLSAGKTQQLHCETTGSVPPARVSWLLDGELLKNAPTSVTETPNKTTSVLLLRPRAGDDGKEIACRAENKHFLGGMLEDRRRLNVAYPPSVTVQLESNIDLNTVKEGDDALLSCEVRANPQPESNSVTWYHGDQLLDYNESVGILPEGHRLTLRGITKESAGDYSCAAVNKEGETRSSSVFLRVQYSPRCREGFTSRRIGAIRHETLDVKCEVTADPRDDVKFSWTYNKSRDVLPVPGSRVIHSGLISVLRYTPESEVDYGTLACWASNSIGRQSVPCLFHIVAAKIPQPPEDCILRNRSSGSLEVQCVAGFDGDLPQHFMLEVSEATVYSDTTPPSQKHGGPVTLNDQGTRHVAPGPPLYRVFGAEPMFALNTLEPGRDYELAVYAVNAKGRSDPPVIIPRVRVSASVERLTKTADTVEEVPTSHHPMTIVLGVLIAAAVIILGGIFITATLVICRRRSATSQLQQDERDDVKLRQEQRPNVYSDSPTPLNPATVFPVPSHVQRRCCTDSVPRIRFRTDDIEMEDRRCVYMGGIDDSLAVGKTRNQSTNEPDLIVSRAEVILSTAASQQPNT
ncbi:hemicentin-2-like isoform X4 [Zootermopsis nevadensis]|nr:hemicentin-2-like isoform X4 [Zootermopsis nevadensis]XP_021935854.1 hemicentin-2-like isoform X4 [Zootermopsis nevadensis]XP_021935855.1 hemicentin-2-like isoform X4 [Zootermopsis nevadensis]